jgi:hypothetical protein
MPKDCQESDLGFRLDDGCANPHRGGLRAWLVAALATTLLTAAQCDSGDSSDSSSAASTNGCVRGISVTPSTVFVQVGQSRFFENNLRDSCPGWELQIAGSPCDPNVCGRLSNGGLSGVTYTAPASPPPPDGKVDLYAEPGPAVASITVTVNPVVDRILTVQSANRPAAPIGVVPNDNFGLGDGTTSVSRTFDDQVDVTLTVPVQALGGWTGCDSVTTDTAPSSHCHVRMTADRTVTAHYGPFITAVTPSTGAQGRVLSPSFTGANLVGSPTVQVTDPNGASTAGGITVSNIVVQSSSAMTADLTIDANALVGRWTMTVVTSEGSSDPIAFDVTPAAPLSCQDVGTSHVAADIVASERWTAAASPHHVGHPMSVSHGATLTIDPGSLVCLGPDAEIGFVQGGMLAAGGPGPTVVFTAQAGPAQPWASLSFGDVPARPSSITNARIEMAQGSRTSGNGAAIETDNTHPLSITDSLIQQITNTALDIESPGSTVARSTIDGSGSAPGHPMVIIRSAITFSSRVRNAQLGVDIIGASVTLSGCEIADSVQIGVRVGVYGPVTGTTIVNCNILNNALTLHVPNGDAVLAQRNWWGPAGPPSLPPSIDTSLPLAAPVVLGY